MEASTVIEGLRVGSRRNGAALLTTHDRLGTKGAATYRAMLRTGDALGHLAIVQGLLWQAVGIDEQAAAIMSGYQTAASLAAAAVRLGLVGAIKAQATIARVLPLIEGVVAAPVSEGDPIRSFVPLAEIAIALHGSGGQRLFSN
jgi:urease accessory protein